MKYQLIIEDHEQRVAAEDLELTDLELAASEALLGFREVLADHIRSGKAFTINAIHIADHVGEILATVNLGKALSGIVEIHGLANSQNGSELGLDAIVASEIWREK
ncbi:hypothetical protein KX729_32545 [Rhizobium sp. XQZ8]|uniref:DUF6894 family protein n=1 Tax=Rhizobium populisoli TaxID=2859785 RepID=UPI001CA486DE|nr:hypothetical protein [Rhizobium populisoli]MBW6426095.1 hypothetical protein [Rhizobium populisoli]